MVAVMRGNRAAKKFERVGRRGGIGDQRLLDGLARVERFETGKLGIALPQDVSGAPENPAALDRLQPRPGRLRLAAASIAIAMMFSVAARLAMVSPVAG